MIKINLARVRKGKPEGVHAGIPAVPKIEIRELFKVGGEYYAGLLLWLVFVGMLGYYWKATSDIKALKEEVNRLKVEKTRLQGQAQRFMEEKNRIEKNIARLREEIQDIDRGKDIITTLKAYYEPFNSGLSFYTSYVPRTSWMSSYKQTFDINQGLLKVELEINSLDYRSLSLYGNTLSRGSQKVLLTQVERKVNAHGFEYYSAKLTTERQLR